MTDKKELLKGFALFSLGTGGIGSWLGEDTDDVILERLARVESDPIRKVQMTQLLALGNEAPLSDGFFQYYWLSTPTKHPYDVTRLPKYNSKWSGSVGIVSLDHLFWGLYRLYTDGLLWFGDVRTAYRSLRNKSLEQPVSFFEERRFNTDLIKKRGLALPLANIVRDDRYLISEQACKSYGESPETPSDLKRALNTRRLGAIK